MALVLSHMPKSIRMLKTIPSYTASPTSTRTAVFTKIPPLPIDTTLLLTGKTEEHTEPVGWTRNHHGGRVFYTSLGHQRDFEIEMFLRLLANGVLWVGGQLETT